MQRTHHYQKLIKKLRDKIYSTEVAEEGKVPHDSSVGTFSTDLPPPAHLRRLEEQETVISRLTTDVSNAVRRAEDAEARLGDVASMNDEAVCAAPARACACACQSCSHRLTSSPRACGAVRGLCVARSPSSSSRRCRT